MARVNENFLKLPGSYLFSTVGKKVREYLRKTAPMYATPKSAMSSVTLVITVSM